MEKFRENLRYQELLNEHEHSNAQFLCSCLLSNINNRQIWSAYSKWIVEILNVLLLIQSRICMIQSQDADNDVRKQRIRTIISIDKSMIYVFNKTFLLLRIVFQGIIFENATLIFVYLNKMYGNSLKKSATCYLFYFALLSSEINLFRPNILELYK